MNKSDIMKAAEEADEWLGCEPEPSNYHSRHAYKNALEQWENHTIDNIQLAQSLCKAAELLKQVDNKWLPASEAPKGVPLIVEGGIAMKKTGDEWFTGMHEPQYTRKIQWEVKWFQFFPQPPVIIEKEGV